MKNKFIFSIIFLTWQLAACSTPMYEEPDSIIMNEQYYSSAFQGNPWLEILSIAGVFLVFGILGSILKKKK